MGTLSGEALGPIASTALDRWFFSVVAGSFLLIAIVGFAPNSAAIINGSMTNPEPLVHLHAAAMFSWLTLFFIQANLIRVGKKGIHARVGQALFVLGPLVVLLMIYLAVTRFPDDGRAPMTAAFQAERIILFSSFLILAAINRKRDASAHKRLLLLATIVPLDAALNRMPWLPGFGLAWSTPLWMPVLLVPLCMFDYFQFGRLHKVTAIGGGLIAAFWVTIVVWLILLRQ